MTKRKSKEEKFLDSFNKILKSLCIIFGMVLSIIYLVDGGFYSLMFDLKESKNIVVYIISIIILLCILVVLNLFDETPLENDKKWETSSYVTVGIIILILIFILLLIFTLIDFLLPIIVLIIFLIITYHLIKKIIKILVNKYGIK